jgi:hypothetical protein
MSNRDRARQFAREKRNTPSGRKELTMKLATELKKGTRGVYTADDCLSLPVPAVVVEDDGHHLVLEVSGDLFSSRFVGYNQFTAGVEIEATDKLYEPLWVLAQQLDEADINQYCEPSPEMNAISDAINAAPASDRDSVTAMLARILYSRLCESRMQ